MPAESRAPYEKFFARDFSAVRLHHDGAAARNAQRQYARAYSQREDIFFGANEFAPGSESGQRLIAHEFAHMADGPSQKVRRQIPEESRGPAFNSALLAGDDERAVRVLNEMRDEEMLSTLRALGTATLLQLRAAAVAVYGPASNRVINAIEVVGGEPVRTAAVPIVAGPPAPPPVSSLSSMEKLGRAIDYACDEMGPAFATEIRALFTPQAIGMLVGFIVLYIASQLTPIGWVADILAGIVIGLSVLFLGLMLIDIGRDLLVFFQAVDATTDEQLHHCGSALARATAKAGVALVIMLLTHCIGRGVGGPRPRPLSGYALAELSTGELVLQPVAATAAEAAPSAIQGTAALMVVGTPPGGSSGSHGGMPAASGGGEPPPRGEEVFAELSEELGMAAEDPAATGDPVADARAAGLTDAAGRPRGPVDLAVQSHGGAPTVRDSLGVTGADANSAHIGPTSGLRDVPGYSRSGALTTLMDPAMHRAFDAHWQNWAMTLRRTGRTAITAGELYAEMLDAIQQIPGMSQRGRNALAWRLQIELFSDLGLNYGSPVRLPYPNITPP